MDNKVIVAAVQMQMRLYSDVGEFSAELTRFLRLAQAKKARLIVFPELTALMAAAPLIGGVRAGLLKNADLARRRDANFWTRVRSRLASSTADILRADYGRSLQNFLRESGRDGGLSGAQLLWSAYHDVLSGLAKQFQITIVAGSGYLPGLGEALRHTATVFGPDGSVIGQASKVVLSPEEPADLAPGDGWKVINTDVGRLGVILGADATFPEVGRILAYQGAEAVIVLGASVNAQRWQAMRTGAQALVQQNQIYGLCSFLIGNNPLASVPDQTYQGRSAILAPLALTHRSTGVMVEMGTAHVEGILTAEWDFDVLSELWVRSDPPVRRAMPAALMQVLLHELNPNRTLDEAWSTLPPSPRRRPTPPAVPMLPGEVIDVQARRVLELPSGAAPLGEEVPAEVTSATQPPAESEVETTEGKTEQPSSAPAAPAIEPVPVVTHSGSETEVLSEAEVAQHPVEAPVAPPMQPLGASQPGEISAPAVLPADVAQSQAATATPEPAQAEVAEVQAASPESAAVPPETVPESSPAAAEPSPTQEPSAEGEPSSEATTPPAAAEPIFPPEPPPPPPKRRGWWPFGR